MIVLQLILWLSLAVNSSTLSIGFKLNKSENQKLIIGQISSNASSIQVFSILQQLDTIKNDFMAKRKGSKISMRIEKFSSLKTKSYWAPRTFYLYDLDNFSLTDFILSQISIAQGSNYSIQSYVTLLPKPQLLIQEEKALNLNINFDIDFVNDSVLVDFDDYATVAADSTELRSIVIRPESPVLNFDDIYSKNPNLQQEESTLLTGLLHEKSKKRVNYCDCLGNCVLS